MSDVRAAMATLPGPPPFPDDVTMYRSWGVGEWYSADWIRSHLSDPTNFQFEDVDVEAVGKDLVMESPSTFVDTFSVMIPMIIKRFWSEQDRREKADLVVPALLRYMNGKYGEGKPVRMHWVANLVTATKPLDFTLGTATIAEKVSGQDL